MEKLKRNGSIIVIFAVFSAIVLLPQLNQHALILGGDSSFHLNRFYDAMMQIKRGDYQYFISLDGFFQSGRVVNALYGPYLAYFNGWLLLITGSWFKYQLVSDWLVNLLAALSMYYLLRTNRVRKNYSVWLALFFVTTYCISTWTLNQQFLAWGTALMPLGIAAATRMIRQPKEPVKVLELTLAVTAMMQTHVLSTLFLVVILAIFFVIAWFKTSKRVDLVKKVMWSALLTLLLTSNVWGAMLELYSSNHLLAPFKNTIPLSNGIVNFTADGSQMSLWMALLVTCQVALSLFNWQRWTLLNKTVTIVGGSLLIASTSLLPWDTLFKWIPGLSMLQFPYRLLGPASILLLLGLGLSLTMLADTHEPAPNQIDGKRLALAIVTLLSTLTLLADMQKSAENWGSDHVLKSRFNMVQRLSGQALRDKFTSPDFGQALIYTYKPTPDYLPMQTSGSATSQAYLNYQQEIAENRHFKKRVHQGKLIVTWYSQNAKLTTVSVVKYRHTKLWLNGKKLTSKDYRLSPIGAVKVQAQPGFNQLELAYKPGKLFNGLMVVNLFAWLGMAIFLAYTLVQRYRRQHANSR